MRKQKRSFLRVTILKYLICSGFLLSAVLAFPQDGSAPPPSEENAILETGPFLFIPGPRRCDVYIDGVYIGATPIFLTDIKDGQHLLELRNATRVGRVEFVTRSGITAISTCEPEMRPYAGSLTVSSVPDGAAVLLNGEAAGKTPVTIPDLRTGVYTVSVRQEGFFPVEETVEVAWERETRLDLPLMRGYRFSLEPLPPAEADARIDITDSAGQAWGAGDFTPEETIILPVGEWNVSVTGNTFYPLKERILVSDSDVVLSFNPEPYYGTILFSPRVDKKWAVFLDEREITAEIADGSVPVPAGSHSLVIKMPPYLPFTQEFSLGKDQMVTILPVFERDLRYVREIRRKIGIPTAISGLVLTAGGLIFNTDSIVIALTDSYENYSLVKYSTLGVMGAGLLFSTIGGLLIVE